MVFLVFEWTFLSFRLWCLNLIGRSVTADNVLDLSLQDISVFEDNVFDPVCLRGECSVKNVIHQKYWMKEITSLYVGLSDKPNRYVMWRTPFLEMFSHLNNFWLEMCNITAVSVSSQLASRKTAKQLFLQWSHSFSYVSAVNCSLIVLLNPLWRLV